LKWLSKKEVEMQLPNCEETIFESKGSPVATLLPLRMAPWEGKPGMHLLLEVSLTYYLVNSKGKYLLKKKRKRQCTIHEYAPEPICCSILVN
jgi:hypothetical protein